MVTKELDTTEWLSRKGTCIICHNWLYKKHVFHTVILFKSEKEKRRKWLFSKLSALVLSSNFWCSIYLLFLFVHHPPAYTTPPSFCFYFRVHLQKRRTSFYKTVVCSYKGKYSDFSFLYRGNQSLPTVCFSPWVSFATHMKHFISDSSGQTWGPQQSVLSDTSWTLFSRSVVYDSLQLCDPMDCNTWGFPVHPHLLELAQTHVHWVHDVIQPSHPLSSLPSAGQPTL